MSGYTENVIARQGVLEEVVDQLGYVPPSKNLRASAPTTGPHRAR